MAKKIRLDFSKTEERSGWNTKHIAEGLNKMKVEAVQETEAQDGTAMLIYALVPTDPKYKTRRFPYYCKLQQNQLWKLRDLFVAAGISVPKKATSIDPAAPVGKFIAAEVEDDPNPNYAGRSVVNGTYGLDILDEDGEAGEEPDEDEEYEDEAEEAEEEYDDEEEDDEEDEDEDDDLDEEDLDDEDLEDDEDEDEEEEEPAPKRRTPAAKAAPAKKKAPAKAAPAKRVVKRR